MGTKLRKNLFWTNKKGFFKLLKLRKIRGKNWGKQDWWFDVTNKIFKTKVKHICRYIKHLKI